MKIYKTALNKLRLSLNKEEWISIGKQKGWVTQAQISHRPSSEKETYLEFRVSVDPETVNSFGKVFYDQDFELGLKMDKEQSKIVYDLLNNKAQSQEGVMFITIVSKAQWNSETLVPYQDTQVGLGDSGWEQNSVEISEITLDYVDRITQKKTQIQMSPQFVHAAEEALDDYLGKLEVEFDDDPEDYKNDEYDRYDRDERNNF